MTTTKNREAQIVADPNIPVVTITREFDAPPERVFRAWEDPELVKHLDRARARWRWTSSSGTAAPAAATATPRATTARRWPGSTAPSTRPGPGERLVQTFTWEGMPDAVCLETMTFEALEGGRSRIVSTTVVDSMEAQAGMLASGMEVGINEGYEKLDELLAAGRSMSAPPRSTAGWRRRLHRPGAGYDRLGRPGPGRGLGRARRRTPPRGVVPAVPEGRSRGCELARGPSVDEDPVAAWQVHSDAVQALLDDPATPSKVLQQPAHRRGAAGRGGRPVLHRRRVHAHVGPGPRDRPGRDPRRRTSAR